MEGRSQIAQAKVWKQERELKMNSDRKYGNTGKSVCINQSKEVDVSQQWTLKERKGSGVCIRSSEQCGDQKALEYGKSLEIT